ncbi:hypothetical protein ACP70R_018377 [Stipagrostis hirtigluma subsp. patula]
MDEVKAEPVANGGELTLSVLVEDHQGRSPTIGAGLGYAMPEHEVNWFVLLEMFFQSASSSIGTIGFVWATVVLLGGFVSKLDKTEFWFVTVLSFFQAMRVFGGDWNSDQMILYGLLLPQRTSRHRTGAAAHTLPLVIRVFTRVMIFMETPIAACCTPNWPTLFICGKLLLLVAAITIRLLRLMALLGCVALFATHVTLQCLGRTAGDAEDTNMRASLNLFYGLAVAQALLSYMVVVLSSSRATLVEELRRRRGLGGLDDENLGLYYSHVRATCRSRGLPVALQATLIRFALESITSATHSVRQSGVETLHVLMESTAEPSSPWSYGEKAAQKTRDSPEAMESLFWMAALASPDEAPKRARAACVLARLAGAGLRVSGIPSAIPSICSLLQAPVSALVLKGKKILERLSRNADNLTEICSSDPLMSIMAEFTSRDQLAATTDALGFRKASTSLVVMARLARAVANQGDTPRQVMLRNVRLMSHLRAILWSPGVDSRLRMLAVRTAAGFAFDGESRNSAAVRQMVVPLLAILCSSSPHCADDDDLILEAGKALAMLTVESQPNCAAILAADDDLHALCSMLFDERRAACGAAVARVLANLCASSDPGSHGALVAFIAENISEVLRRTCEVQDHGTEDLEPLLCLGRQFARWTSARHFSDALHDVGRESYIRRLVLTAGDTRYPGALRLAIEQAIWIVQNEQELHCVKLFIDNGMEAALLQVQGAVAGIDDYKLLSPNGPVLEHEEPLPSVVRRALKLIRTRHRQGA